MLAVVKVVRNFFVDSHFSEVFMVNLKAATEVAALFQYIASNSKFFLYHATVGHVPYFIK